MRWIFRNVVGLSLILALAACGSGAAGEAYERMQRQVAGVRDAAEARDATIAAQRIADLRANVAQLSQDGVIGQPDAERILTAAAEVEANLNLIAPPAPVPPPPAPAPVPPPLEIQVPGSNAGGSVTGKAGERGRPGERGAKGRNNDGDNDNDN